MGAQPQHCAVMFADLAGSTALYDTLGDEKAKAAVQGALQRMADIAGRHRGRVVKSIGDELLLCYPSAADAVAAATAMQMAPELRLSGPASGLRIGLHVGEVISDANDVFGDVVNVAARLTAAARTGQILTTEQAVSGLQDDLRRRTRAFDIVLFKGKTQRMRVFEVLWEDDANITKLAGTHRLATGGEGSMFTHIELNLGTRTLTLDEDQMPFTLGRDATCGLIVNARLASRVHAKVEYKRGKFVLTDQSTNGTYVAASGEPEVFLRRESMPVLGNGTISLGCPATEQPDVVVAFRTM